MSIITFMKDLLRTAAMSKNGCEDYIQLRNLRLPPAHMRQCTAEFKDDEYFVASGESEGRRLIEHCALSDDSRILEIGCGSGRLPIGQVETMPVSESATTDSTGLAVLGLHGRTRALVQVLQSIYWLVMKTLPVGWLVTRVNVLRHRHFRNRKLEIGPGDGRIDGFETLDIILRRNVDFVVDASRRLPFSDATFQVVYASHILEHVPWYRLEETLREWVRIIKPGGVLEIWVPNGLEICRVFVEYETTGHDCTDQDGWYRFNPEKDPCLWAAGRIFTYGDGHGGLRSPNWHRAIFSPRFLHRLMTKVGLVNVQEMDRADVRGYDHGWINLGFRGTKR